MPSVQMRINHHISVLVNWRSRWSLGRAGIRVDEHIPDCFNGGVAVFDIEESDPRWPRVERLVRPLDMLDVVSTHFDRQELLAS